MDLSKTGSFIAERRKEKKFTQVKLAEMIGVSEKTISKWETGRGFPDTSLMLPLCEALEISANELLSAKILSENEYKRVAENNLIELKSRQINSTKHLLTLEWVIGFMAVMTLFAIIFAVGYAQMATGWKVFLVVVGVLNFFVGMFFAIKIETEAGFYECEYCHHKYIPSYHSVLWAMHFGRTRYLKCPKCHKRSWSKKRISDD